MKLRYGAKALIRRRTDHKFLMLRSSEWKENPRRSQKPDLPGGLIEDGETIAEGLLREIKEEAGFNVSPADLKLAYAFVWDEEDISTVFQAYFAEVDDPDVILSWEHESYEWMTREEILSLEIREPYPTIFKQMERVGLI